MPRPQPKPSFASSQKHAGVDTSLWREKFVKAVTFEDKSLILSGFATKITQRSSPSLSFDRQNTVRNMLIDMLSEWSDAALHYRPSIPPIGLCHALSTYARLKLTPPEKVSEYLLQETKEKMADMNAIDLRFLLNAIVDLAIYPGDEWVELWAREADAKCGQWSMEEGFSSLQKMATVDLLRGKPEECESSPIRKMALPMMNFLQKRSNILSANQLDRQVYLAGLWFGYDFVDQFRVEQETHTASNGEARLARIFESANILKAEDIFVSRIEHRVDLSHQFNEVSVGCELDGVSHFVEDRENGRMVYDGQTRFQTWLIENLMPAETILLRVPDFIMKSNVNPDFWREAIEMAAEKDSGGYVLHDSNDIRHASAPEAWAISY